jgi:hypothetical protein
MRPDLYSFCQALQILIERAIRYLACPYQARRVPGPRFIAAAHERIAHLVGSSHGYGDGPALFFSVERAFLHQAFFDIRYRHCHNIFLHFVFFLSDAR